MSKKYINSNELTTGLRITTKSPIDDRAYFETVQDVINFIEIENGALLLHDGIRIMVTNKPGGTDGIDNYVEYTWVESPSGLLDTSFTYPSWQGDYTGKNYNFVVAIPNVLIKRRVISGTTSITVDSRYLPYKIIQDKIANVFIYESTHDTNPGLQELVIPNYTEIKTNEITNKTELHIYFKPAYEADTDITIKIT